MCGFCAEKANPESFVSGTDRSEMVLEDGKLTAYSITDETFFQFDVKFCPLCGAELKATEEAEPWHNAAIAKTK